MSVGEEGSSSWLQNKLSTKNTTFQTQTKLFFERLARVVETVGSSQVDDRPASFNRFRGLDKEGRSFRLLVWQAGWSGESFFSSYEEAPGLWQFCEVGVGWYEGVRQKRWQ